MKLINILGAVVAAHVAVLVLAVAIPGCRSTRTTAPAAGTDEPSAAAYSAPARSSGSPTFTAAPELSDRDLNPPVARSTPLTFDPDAPAVSGGGAGRYSPTRPDSSITSGVEPPSISAAPLTPATTYTVQRGDNLWTLAKKNGVTVRELAAANNIPADSMLRLGQVLVIPGQQSEPAASSLAAADQSGRTYTIQAGDTLSGIAKRHGISLAQLKAFNRLTTDLVRVGDTLSIPESATEPTSEVVTRPTAPTADPAATASAGAYKHVVAPGESVYVIARRYGVKTGELILANMIKDPALIRAGQELIIPGWKSTDSPAPATTASRTTSQPAANRLATNPPASTTTPSSTDLTAEGDLDDGLDTTLDNVPVIDVERAPAPAEEDDEPIRTISIGGGSGGGGGGGDNPPLFQ